MKKRMTWVAALAALTIAGIVYAAVTGDRSNWYVDPANGSNSNNGTSPSRAWKGLEFALANASVGDGDNIVIVRGRVTLASETAAGGDMAEIGPSDPNITIRGATGNANDVIIDFAGTVYTTQDGISNETASFDGFQIRDLTIANYICSGTRSAVLIYSGGGGIDNVVIDNVTFSNCGPSTAARNVPALYVQHSTTQGATWGINLVVNNCRFINMNPLWGERLWLSGATSGGGYENFRITNCQFNTDKDLYYRSGAAGGIQATDIDSLVISGCTMYSAGNWGASTTDETDDAEGYLLFGCDRVHIQGCYYQRYLYGFQIGVTSVVSRPGEPEVLVLTGGNAGDHPLHNSDGVVTLAQSGRTCDSLYVESCVFWGAGHGFQLDQINKFWIRDCVFDSTYDDGGFVQSVADGAAGVRSTIERNIFHYTGNGGVDIQGDNFDLQHNTFVRTNDNPIRVLDTSAGCNIRSNLVYDIRAIVPASGTGAVVNAFADYGHETNGPPVSVTSWNYNGYYDTDIGDRQFLNMTGAGTGTYDTFAVWQAVPRDANGFMADPLFFEPNSDPIGRPGCFRVKNTGPAHVAGHDGTAIGCCQSEWTDVSRFVQQPGQVTSTYPQGAKNSFGQIQFIPVGAPTTKLRFVPGFLTSYFEIWAHTKVAAAGAEPVLVNWSGPTDNASTTLLGPRTAWVPNDAPETRRWFVEADTVTVWVKDNTLAASDSVFVTFAAYPK